MCVHRTFWNLLYIIKYKIFVTPGSPGGWVLEPPGDPGAGNFFCWNPRGVRGRGIFLSPGGWKHYSITNLAHDFKSPFLDIEITMLLLEIIIVYLENAWTFKQMITEGEAAILLENKKGIKT